MLRPSYISEYDVTIMMTFSGVKEIAFVWLQNDDLVRMHSSRHLRRTIEHRVAYRLKPVCRGFTFSPCATVSYLLVVIILYRCGVDCYVKKERRLGD